MGAKDKNREDVQIQSIPHAYDLNDSEASALHLLYTLYPEWESSPGPVKIKPFTEGIMNTLLKLSKERPGQSKSDNENEAILLRAYGNGSDIFVDRDLEALTHTLLTQEGLAAPLLARFQNGLLYRFSPGRMCTAQDLGKEPIWRSVAARLGEWHAKLPLPKQEAGKERNIFSVLKQWVNELPVDQPKDDERKKMYERELRYSLSKLGQDGAEDQRNFVLGHCDLLSANIIIPTNDASSDDLSRPVNFIDYEFAMPCPAAFDLANHFSEWGGFDCDYSMLPTRHQRRSFLACYLDNYKLHAAKRRSAKESAVPDLEELFVEVDGYRGIPGLYWGVHALINAKISQVEFDWSAYAGVRLKEYWDWRGEEDGSRAKEGREIPLRERRWAEEG